MDVDIQHIQAYKHTNKTEEHCKQGAQTMALGTSSQPYLYISGCTACLTTKQFFRKD